MQDSMMILTHDRCSGVFYYYEVIFRVIRFHIRTLQDSMMILTHGKGSCVFCYDGIIFRAIKLYTYIAGFNDDTNPW